MEMTKVLFNRNELVRANSMEQPTDLEIKNTFGLWNSSYEDAIRYGGDVTRNALQTMHLHHDRKNIIVDTKIHMLMPGWSPSIPGWHADGAPRDVDNNPQGNGLPDTFAQEKLRYNRYHILVTGTGCLTQFINRPMDVPVPSSPSYEVYSLMSKFIQDEVSKNTDIVTPLDSCTAFEFNWWNIHTGIVATKKEWRYLIRVCESDYYEPRKDLREVIRMQSQVYSPQNFGW